MTEQKEGTTVLRSRFWGFTVDRIYPGQLQYFCGEFLPADNQAEHPDFTAYYCFYDPARMEVSGMVRTELPLYESTVAKLLPATAKYWAIEYFNAEQYHQHLLDRTYYHQRWSHGSFVRTRAGEVKETKAQAAAVAAGHRVAKRRRPNTVKTNGVARESSSDAVVDLTARAQDAKRLYSDTVPPIAGLGPTDRFSLLEASTASEAPAAKRSSPTLDDVVSRLDRLQTRNTALITNYNTLVDNHNALQTRYTKLEAAFVGMAKRVIKAEESTSSTLNQLSELAPRLSELSKQVEVLDKIRLHQVAMIARWAKEEDESSKPNL